MTHSTSHSERENKDDLILMICAQNNKKKVCKLSCVLKKRRKKYSLCTVGSSFAFHISNSRQHAVSSKEQENKCQALIRIILAV